MKYTQIDLFIRLITLAIITLYQASRHDATTIGPLLLNLALTVILMMAYLLYRNYQQEAGRVKRIRQSRWAYQVCFLILTALRPSLVTYLPVLIIDLDFKSSFDWILACLQVTVCLLLGNNTFEQAATLGLAGLAGLARRILGRLQQVEHSSYQQIDHLRQLNHRFRQEQDQLLRLQDQTIETSRNEERKRITGEIHDILGHQISSSIIQLGALQYIIEDSNLKNRIGQVEAVLQEGMNNIRQVIHSERQDSIDLQVELDQLVNEFYKCPISFVYDNQTPLKLQASHAIISAVREALTNINKHSNASRVQVRFIEGTGAWNLLIIDNGNKLDTTDSNRPGIGLVNMEERIQRLRGQVHISQDKGFRIFINLPKEGNRYENPIN